MFENASDYFSSIFTLEGSKLYVFIIILILLFVLGVHAYIKYSVKKQVNRIKRKNIIDTQENLQNTIPPEVLLAQQQAHQMQIQQAQLQQAQLQQAQMQLPQPAEDSSFVDPVGSNLDDDDLGLDIDKDLDEFESHLDMEIMEHGGVKNTQLRPSNVMMRDLIDNTNM